MKWASDNDFIRGAMAGAISAIVICLMFEVLELFKLVTNCWLFMAGQSVMRFQHNIPQSVLAFLIHLGVGAFWGIIIALLFSKVFTEKYYLFKGTMFGFAIFFLHIGLLFNVFHYPTKIRANVLTVFFIFLSYLIYGALTVVIIKKLSRNPV